MALADRTWYWEGYEERIKAPRATQLSARDAQRVACMLQAVSRMNSDKHDNSCSKSGINVSLQNDASCRVARTHVC